MALEVVEIAVEAWGAPVWSITGHGKEGVLGVGERVVGKGLVGDRRAGQTPEGGDRRHPSCLAHRGGVWRTATAA